MLRGDQLLAYSHSLACFLTSAMSFACCTGVHGTGLQSNAAPPQNCVATQLQQALYIVGLPAHALCTSSSMDLLQHRSLQMTPISTPVSGFCHNSDNRSLQVASSCIWGILYTAHAENGPATSSTVYSSREQTAQRRTQLSCARELNSCREITALAFRKTRQ